MSFWRQWRPYVPVASRRASARREMGKLREKGRDIQPVEIEGRAIARSFWGKGWCDHLESFSDYANRLPRGRTYVRNGSVCHLAVRPGRIEAIVSGSELYDVNIHVKKLKPSIWKTVKAKCSGGIGSMLELLQGKLSDQVMAVVTDRAQGLFPQPREIELKCSCPDWAVMCKHVAAVLYGVGSRLDSRPELLFLLRDVDAQELISAEITVPGDAATGNVLDDGKLGDIFGIDLDVASEDKSASSGEPKKRRRVNGRANGRKSSGVNGRKNSGASGRANGRAAHTSAAGDNGAQGANGRNGADGGNGAHGAQRKIQPTGKSVARLRGQLTLSVAEFARQLGVSVATVHRWESTKGRLTLRSRPLAALSGLRRQAEEVPAGL